MLFESFASFSKGAVSSPLLLNAGSFSTHPSHSASSSVLEASYTDSAALVETDDIFPILVLTANSTALVVRSTTAVEVASPFLAIESGPNGTKIYVDIILDASFPAEHDSRPTQTNLLAKSSSVVVWKPQFRLDKFLRWLWCCLLLLVYENSSMSQVEVDDDIGVGVAVDDDVDVGVGVGVGVLAEDNGDGFPIDFEEEDDDGGGGGGAPPILDDDGGDDDDDGAPPVPPPIVRPRRRPPAAPVTGLRRSTRLAKRTPRRSPRLAALPPKEDGFYSHKGQRKLESSRYN
jgi:hypothetical protein